MAEHEKRMAPRFQIRLPVSFRNREQQVSAETCSVSRHGLFIETPHLRVSGELMQLSVDLPGELVSLPTTVRMMSVVTWSLTSAEAEQRRRKPGMGLKFFMVAAPDKACWDAFIQGLEERAADGPVQLPAQPLREGPIKFLLRARSVDQLRQFGRQELADGRMFLRTPMVRGMRELVDLVLIHPDTEEEFALPGQVVMVKPTGPVVERGMAIEFMETGLEVKRRFEKFVASYLQLPGQPYHRRKAG